MKLRRQNDPNDPAAWLTGDEMADLTCLAARLVADPADHEAQHALRDRFGVPGHYVGARAQHARRWDRPADEVTGWAVRLAVIRRQRDFRG